MRRYVSSVIVGLALAFGSVDLSFGQVSPKEWAGPKTTVRLGVSGRPDQAFLELAIGRGYFERQGILIEKIPSGSGNDFVAPLALNQLQVASGSPNASLFNALNRGINIRIVADFAHIDGPKDGLVALVVRKDLLTSGAVKSPQDLKGRTISLGTGRGQYSYMLINTILERNNLSWSDVKVQNLAFADTMIAMNNKIIDAGFMIEPLLSAAVEKNIAGVLVTGGDVEVGAHLSILLYSAEFAKQTEVATRFMVAYLQGVRDYTDAFIHHKNQDAAIELLVKVLSVKDPNVWKNAMPQHMYADGKVNIEDIRRQAAVYKKLGDVSGPVPAIEKYVDTQFAEAASKILSAK